MTFPELLSPAGSLAKLKTSILYGADAVYCGGMEFGLRQAADNFTEAELFLGVDFAHQHGAKVYVVLNSFLHNEDLQKLPAFLEVLEAAKVDAVIVSDLGVVTHVREHSSLEVHLSTQASCLNASAAKLWARTGVTRAVLGREVSIAEAAMIKKKSGLEIEMFIHGSMCMAYSGNCVISNYTQGRDSNRGGCAHSCRFEYSFDLGDEKRARAYFMSSKDLEGIRLLPQFIAAEIDSLKVEGRMKSPHYAATVSKVYSEALRYYREGAEFGEVPLEKLAQWERELRKIPHRDYTEASLVAPADQSSIFNDREHEEGTHQVVGKVIGTQGERAVLEVTSAFHPGDTLEAISFRGDNITIRPVALYDPSGEAVTRTRPGTVVILGPAPGLGPEMIVRTVAP